MWHDVAISCEDVEYILDLVIVNCPAGRWNHDGTPDGKKGDDAYVRLEVKVERTYQVRTCGAFQSTSPQLAKAPPTWVRRASF